MELTGFHCVTILDCFSPNSCTLPLLSSRSRVHLIRQYDLMLRF